MLATTCRYWAAEVTAERRRKPALAWLASEPALVSRLGESDEDLVRGTRLTARPGWAARRGGEFPGPPSVFQSLIRSFNQGP